jgi:hypothetical protein
VDAYYYDLDGSRIPLRAAGMVAVDLRVAARTDVGENTLGTVRREGTELRAGIVMVDEHTLDAPTTQALDAAGALHPVYRAGDDALVVVLPEVRIEADDDAQAARVRGLVAAEPASEIVGETGHRLIARPGSGRGLDALRLANRVTETIRPKVAQARLLRVLPRPGPRPGEGGGPEGRSQPSGGGAGP